MGTLLAFLNKHDTALAIILTFVGLLFVGYQLYQVNEHKKWENFNEMNIRYYDWYSNIPEGLNKDLCAPFEHQNNLIKKWTRAYFNLYSEEYWLYQNNLIPKEMWQVRIDNGVDVNLISYPKLVRGYEYWKEKGAFVHPVGFRNLVDNKLIKLKDKLKLNNCPPKKKSSNKASQPRPEHSRK